MQAVGFLSVCLTGCAPQGPEEPAITTVSWGGSYARAFTEAAVFPFEDSAGVRVEVEDYNGGLAQIRAQVDAGDIYWDVVDMELSDSMQGCEEGLLERIDLSEFPLGVDGTPAVEDFADTEQGPCWAPTLFYSTVYAYNEELFPDEQPSTLEDFFDLERFPGRRGMRRVPIMNLEFALMADGVALEEVYGVLDTPDGLDRAFRKLDTIKEQVVWWEAGAQPPQMLADAEVVMSTAYNGRIFNAQVLEDQPFQIVWDGQVLDSGGLVIVSGTPRFETALRFVKAATAASTQAGIGSRISYSPGRRSAEPLISTHLTAEVEMAPHLPNAAQNTTRALRYSAEWWLNNRDELNERFSAWIAR